MIRLTAFPIDEVLPFAVDPEAARRLKKAHGASSPQYWEFATRVYAGERVKMDSQRYQLFAAKGVRCVRCGFEGTYFILEAHEHANSEYLQYHFNLYGLDMDGKEIMMTKDHIVPKSKGGKNILDNYQPMCFVCNVAKGSECER